LVGREQEVELLVAALARAREEREPQLVTLVGVPGIGKSRLLGELFAAIDKGNVLTTWRQGRSLSYGEGVSYWALGEMVKAQAGILETDAPDEAGRKLGEAVGRSLPDEAEARWVGSHLRPLAGLVGDDVSGDRRGEAFAAWRRFFEALAEQRPLVLVFEDLHWADDGLLDFIDHLVDWLTDVPVLVVASARPELLARRPAWGGGKANATTVSLSPLSDEETARLVHALLEQSVLPAEVQSALLERAGGNPLYAEEFVRMVAERGHDRTELPESVQGIIAARLDDLPPEDKGLLQDAAVVGKVFWSGALAAIGARERFAVEERLHALERRELVRRERRSSVAGESEYAFRHVLVRDVAYSAIPRAARAERHRAAAEWIESLGRPEDHADLLAHHYLSALELARAAGVDPGEFAGPAATALQRAGDRAFALNAFHSAARFYGEALELGVDERERPRVLFRLGAALHLASDERRIEILEEARDALVAAGDPESAAEASLLLAEAWWYRGERDRSREHLAQAQELLGERGASPAAIRVLAAVGLYRMLADETDEAIATARQALTLADELGSDESRPLALNVLGTARANSGDLGGIADLERSIEIAVAANDPEAARAYINLGSQLYWQGELSRGADMWRKGKEVADRLGNASVGRFISGVAIWFDHDVGNWDDALHAADVFVAECETGSPHYLEGDVQGLRARILFARDEVDEALAAAARAVELGRKAKDPQVLRPALETQLRINLRLGRMAEARTVSRELVSLGGFVFELALTADSLGIRDEVHAVIAELPETRWTRAARAIVEGQLEEAADLIEAMGGHSYQADVRLQAAKALVAQGRRGEADAQLAKALAFFRSVRATRYIREAESLLAATA
ncbi:MAG: AAA family ATPase, partial [Actinobacteria bacterium]|nr:AAA family ATPase [Actinomycetota bacterium]